MARYVHFASRLTGWNAIRSRAQQLNISMTEKQYKECTAKIKALADIRPIAMDDADSIIRTYYRNIQSGENNPLMDLNADEIVPFAAKKKEPREVPSA